MQVVKNRIISRIRKIISIWIFVQIGFVFSANAGDIVITEFFYNKSAGNLPEYVELFNKSESTIDLNGWKVEIDGIQVEIDVTFNIDSHNYGVILSSSGLLRSYDGTEETTYCSSSHYGFPFNVCEPYRAQRLPSRPIHTTWDFVVGWGLEKGGGGNTSKLSIAQVRPCTYT